MTDAELKRALDFARELELFCVLTKVGRRVDTIRTKLMRRSDLRALMWCMPRSFSTQVLDLSWVRTWHAICISTATRRFC